MEEKREERGIDIEVPSSIVLAELKIINECREREGEQTRGWRERERERKKMKGGL